MPFMLALRKAHVKNVQTSKTHDIAHFAKGFITGFL